MQGEGVEDQIEATERHADRSRVKLFLEALKNSRLPRALDLASRMNTALALEGALKLANQYRHARVLTAGLWTVHLSLACKLHPPNWMDPG